MFKIFLQYLLDLRSLKFITLLKREKLRLIQHPAKLKVYINVNTSVLSTSSFSSSSITYSSLAFLENLQYMLFYELGGIITKICNTCCFMNLVAKSLTISLSDITHYTLGAPSIFFVHMFIIYKMSPTDIQETRHFTASPSASSAPSAPSGSPAPSASPHPPSGPPRSM